MNILFIGHLHEKSGWGNAARLYLKALIATGHNVYARSIYVIDGPHKLDDADIERCLALKIPENIDICIQNILPSMMSYQSGMKNVGLFFTETKNLKHTPWVNNLKLMDALFVPNMEMEHEFRRIFKSKKPVYNIYTPIEEIDPADYKPLDLPIHGNYVFYFIGELNRRKNIEALIRAFHNEFSSNEPVSLVIKSYKYGADNDSVQQELDKVISAIKQDMKLYKNIHEYHKEILINEHMERNVLLRLHKSCNCLVAPSFGESICLPAMDAIMMGNNVIATKTGGFKNFIQSDMLVKCRPEPVSAHKTIAGFGSSRELWDNICPLDLQKKMRYVYEKRPVVDRNILNSYLMDNYAEFLANVLDKI